MNLAGFILSHEERETAALIRAGAPTQNASGVFVATTPVETSITVVTHPLSGEDAVKLPEADRVTATIEIYATAVLHVARGAQAADRVRRADGKVYRVVKVDEQKGGIWLAYATLEEPTS